jgi:nucleotide-binding universal stress UspA family protein
MEIPPMQILAFSASYAQWNNSMRYAAELAARLSSRLTGIFVSEPIVPFTPMNVPMAFPDMYTITANITRDARAAEQSFQHWAAGFGVKQPQWVVAEGYLAGALAYAANWHDLLVVGAGGSPWGSVSTLGQILLTCNLPCIVVPDSLKKKAAIDSIAIAWNGSVEAIRTVHAALPLLKDAKQVVLIHGERVQPFSSIAWNPTFDIEPYLAQHDIRFTKRPLDPESPTAGAELLRFAREASADLLVMGAYGRSRFSEWVLGGATRHVLEHCDLPLLMRH